MTEIERLAHKVQKWVTKAQSDAQNGGTNSIVAQSLAKAYDYQCDLIAEQVLEKTNDPGQCMTAALLAAQLGRMDDSLAFIDLGKKYCTDPRMMESLQKLQMKVVHHG